MEKVQDWAIEEFKKVMPGAIYEDDELRPLFANLTTTASEAQINQELSAMLDFTKKDAKKFIKDFVDKVKQVKAYQEKAKRVMK